MSINTIKELAKIADDLVKNNKSLNDMISEIKKYNGNDWKEYVSFSDETYKRNKALSTEFVDVYIICWKKGQCSKIHNHPENGCIVKILSGSLVEKIFETSDDKSCSDVSHVLTNKVNCQNNVNDMNDVNDVLYSSGSKKVHRIEPIEDTISLHIYPNYPKQYVSEYYND